MARRLAGVAVLLAVAAASCVTGTRGGKDVSAPPGGVLLRFDTATVAAEVVASSESRARGLMNRKRLAADAGMLFLFPAPSEGGFWMWHTLIPLSIAYLRWDERSFEVVSIKDMTPCGTSRTQCRRASAAYSPETFYDAALEVNEGWFEEHGVSVGDVAQEEGELKTPS